MSFGKWIDINPSLEKEKYAIFKEIEEDGKAIVENYHEKDWWEGVARSIGHSVEKMKIGDEFVILPPLSTHQNNKQKIAVISTGKMYRIEEKKGLNISRFIAVKKEKP